jgi:hypothetical protein
MPMLAEQLDVVIGGDTHRDSHTLEMLTPAGVVLGTLTVPNTDAGFAAAPAWITGGRARPGRRVG